MKYLTLAKVDILTHSLYLAFTLMIGIWVSPVQSEEIRYRYVSLGIPQNTVDLQWLTDNRKIYGAAIECGDVECTTIFPHVATYDKGVLTVSQSVIQAAAVNNHGTVSGSVTIDPENFITQAALFRNDTVKLLIPLPDEINGNALTLNDQGTVLLQSDSLEGTSYAFFKKGHTTLLNFDSRLFGLSRLHINDKEVVAGTGSLFTPPQTFLDRAFRYNPKTDTTTILNPLPGETNSWGTDLDDQGNVLGYSFNFGSLERIGVWDKKGQFKTYFVEGTPEFPTLSNNVLFNNQGLIVITSVSNPPAERALSYVVPKPGKRLNLADLIVNLPAGHSRQFIIRDMNNRGDLFGFDKQGYVLLKRIDGYCPAP